MTYFWKKEDFAACYPNDKTGGEYWFENAWTVYQAKRAFIDHAYDDQKTRDRLYAYIRPNSADCDYGCQWLDWQVGSSGGVESLLVEANRSGKDRVFDWAAGNAFEEAPQGVAAYLAAPAEFHTRKAEAFFLRYAVDASARLIEHQLAEAKSTLKVMKGIVLVSSAVQAGVAGGLTIFGVENGWSPWVNLPTGAIAAFTVLALLATVARWFFRGPKLRRDFAAIAQAAARYRGVASELTSLSFDPETIAARLKAIEASTTHELPSYVYTLLRRLGSRP